MSQIKKKTLLFLAVVMLTGATYGFYLLHQRDAELRQRFALVAACSAGDTEKVKILLDQGADPNSTHLEGSSALWWAVEVESVPTVRLLLEHGADANSMGQHNSVLENAQEGLGMTDDKRAQARYQEIIRLLREHGAIKTK